MAVIRPIGFHPQFPAGPLFELPQLFLALIAVDGLVMEPTRLAHRKQQTHKAAALPGPGGVVLPVGSFCKGAV